MLRHTQWVGAFALVTALSACAPSPDDESPWMRPGENCQQCHVQNGPADGYQWSAAGTIYDTNGNAVEGATILITDARGQKVTIQSNGAGNFYTAESLVAPFQHAVVQYKSGQSVDMAQQTSTPITGACNTCHIQGGTAETHLYVNTQ